MTLRIAVLSDLHCHHPSAGFAETLLLTDSPRRPAKQHPVSALELLIQSNELKADLVLMPGDLANKADSQGIISGWGFISSIAQLLHAPVVASTLGNHDVIWKEPCDDSFKLARDLWPQFPTNNQDQYNSFWSEGFYFEEQEFYRVLVINSVKHHTNELSAKRGLITDLQLEAINRYLESAPHKDFQIGLCHHHPIQHEEMALGPTDLMENGSRLVELLSKHAFSILVHGHKHHPRLKTDTSWANPITVFASGSFSVGLKLGLGSRIRNVFHLIEMEANQNSVRGKIRTWQFQLERGWTVANASAADFPHLTGFGSLVSPAELASRIENTFRTEAKDVVNWSVISNAIPEIECIPPSVFRTVGELLTSRGIHLTPAAPDHPTYIGVYA